MEKRTPTQKSIVRHGLKEIDRKWRPTREHEKENHRKIQERSAKDKALKNKMK